MNTRNLTHRFGSPAGMPVLALALALAGGAPAQQAGPQAPPEPPWVTPFTAAPPPSPPATVAVPQVLTGHVPLQVAALDLTPIASINPTQPMQLGIVLPLRNQAALNDFLRQLNDPQSSNYRRFLTPQEFADGYGPAESDYAAVIAFAKAHNLAVTSTWPNRTLVDVSGSAADIENTFNVHLLLYQHPYEARQFYAPDVDPSVNFAVPLLHIWGLNDYNLPWSDGGTGSGTNGSFRGSDFRNAYLPDAGSLTGSGQNVGIVAFTGDYFTNDITAYEDACGLTNHVPVQRVQVDGYTGITNFLNTEISQDIEMAIAMAPGVQKIVVYQGYHPWTILYKIATDVQTNFARQISCSIPGWVGSGYEQTNDQLLQQFAAQGQSFFQASGDGGAFNYRNGEPMDPRGEQWLTDVGGTVLTTVTNGGAYISEAAWSWSGGGFGYDPNLVTNAIPWWQTNAPNSTNRCSTQYRNFPDVALTATNIWITYGNGASSTNGQGTSAAAPLWAGVAALANQQAATNRFPPLGFLNPALYTIGLGTNYTKCFHDITTGNNTNSSSTNQFNAVAGYDLCTGWGTPAGIALIDELIRVSDGPLGSGTNGGGSFSFAVDYGTAAPSSSIYWASNVTTALTNWTLLANYTAGTGIVWCSDSTASNGVTARFYRLEQGGQCWRPTGFIRRQLNAATCDLFANQLDAPVNTLNGLFNPMPDGTYLPTNAVVFVQNTNGPWTFNSNNWNGSSWTSGGTNVGDSFTLSPGQGFWIYNPSSTNVTVTFAGLVRQGNLTNTISSYQWIYSSMVPQAGRLQTDLRYVPTMLDDVYLYNGSGYEVYTFYGTFWSPSEPSIALGQSFVLVPAATNTYTWTRGFTTCP